MGSPRLQTLWTVTSLPLPRSEEAVTIFRSICVLLGALFCDLCASLDAVVLREGTRAGDTSGGQEWECARSTQLQSARLGTWPGGMTWRLPPRFWGVPTDCFMVVSCCRRFLDDPGTGTRTFLREAGRLSHAMATPVSRRHTRCVPGGVGKVAFPRDGKAIGNCNCNRRLLPENLSWDRHFSEYVTSVVSCNLPTNKSVLLSF